MTTRGSNDVAFTISAKDRASPVLQNVQRNVGRVQGSVVSMAGSLGTLSSATSGVLGPMGSLIGSMGVMGVAVTGVGLGLSLGINRLRGMREESRKTAQAAEALRNKFLLSGFSADTATSSVDQLRGSLSRVAFQALPGLDFELQGFLGRMDKDTADTFGNFERLLIDALGENRAGAIVAALGEAFQENFGPISELIGRPISSSEDLRKEMDRLLAATIITETGVLGSLRTLAAGTQVSTDEQRTALFNVANVFRENADGIRGILAELTDDERAQVLSFLVGKTQEADELRGYGGAYGENVSLVLGHIQRAIGGEATHTTAVKKEHDARIAEIEKVSPATAQMVRDLEKEYGNNKFDLAVLRAVTEIEFDRIKAEQTGWIDSLESDARRAQRLLASVELALGQAAAAAAGGPQVTPAPRPGQPVPIPRPIPRPVPRQHGGIFTRPEIARVGEVPEVVAPLSRLPSLLEGVGGPRTIIIPVTIGDQPVRTLVIDVLNDEVSLREPSLGLG